MNKLKKTIDNIQLDEYEKNKILRKILNHEFEETTVPKRKVIFQLATFLLTFVFLTGTCFALVKVLHFDDKFRELFDKTDEELTNLGISPSEVQTVKEFKDAKITVTQTIMDEKEVNIVVDIVAKEELIYIEDFFLSSGKVFDESLLEKTIQTDGTTSFHQICTENSIYGCMEKGISALEKTETKTGYILNMSINRNKKDTDEVTLRLLTNKGTYDIPFTLVKNNLKEKEIKYKNVEIFNENGIIVTVDAIRLSPFYVVVSMNYNKDIHTLTDEEIERLGDKVYNENAKEATYVTYKDGTKSILCLWYQVSEEGMTSPYGMHGTKENQINDIENIKSITINGKTFNIE